jgi:beta-lactamase regulating signal transducer with metallopeptidase domain
MMLPFVVAMWLLGTAVLLAFAIRSHRRGWLIRRRSEVTNTSRLQQSLNLARRLVSFQHRTTVLVSDEVQAPMVHGFLEAAVILPRTMLDAVSEDQLTDILIHEFAHVRRRDTLVVAAETVVRGLFWPVVTVHLLTRALGRAREEVCDNYVLAHRDSVDYAETLLTVAQLAGGRTVSIPAVGILNWRGAFEERIAGLLNKRRSRSRGLSSPVAGLLAISFVAGGVALAGSRLVATEPSAANELSARAVDLAGDGPAAVPATRDNAISSMATVEIRVVDPQGKPIVDAQLLCHAMRLKKADGHWLWPKNAGPAPRVSSDEHGVARIKYPTHLDESGYATSRGSDPQSVRKLTVTVWHDRFVGLRRDLEAATAPTITLQLGDSMKLTAIDAETQKPLKRFAALWRPSSDDAEWVEPFFSLSDRGVLSTNSLRKTGEQLMLVAADAQGNHRFSRVLTLTDKIIKTGHLRDVPMEKGSSMRGKLSANVPLPIRDGRVVLGVKMMASDPSFAWYDWAELNDDGSFSIRSLPHASEAQVMAYCDGWSSVNLLDDVGSVRGDYFKLSASTEHILLMQKTFSFNVTVRDTEGNPVPGITVGTYPSQRYFKYGADSAGAGSRYADAYLKPREYGDWPDQSVWREFESKTGVTGRCEITGIPHAGPYAELYITSDGYVLADPNTPGSNGGVWHESKIGKVTRVELIVKKRSDNLTHAGPAVRSSPTDAKDAAQTRDEPQPMAEADVIVMSGRRRIRGARVALKWISGPQRSTPIHGNSAMTDSKGVARLSYPKYVAETFETESITCFVEHPKYAANVTDVKLSESPVSIQIKTGYRILATAVDGLSGQPIRQRLYATGDYLWQKWETNETGTLASPVRGPGPSAFRLVHSPADGPPRFSKVIALKPRRNQRTVTLSDIPVHPGTRLVGNLDSSVARPIKNGRVVALIYGRDKMSSQGADIFDEWVDWTAINEDGSFVFASLPQGEEVQLVATCDGFVSVTNPPSYGIGMGGRVMGDLQPRVVNLSEVEQSTELQMEPAAVLRLRLADPAGQPVAGATVQAYLNYQWHSRYANLLRTRYRTIDALRGKRSFQYEWISGTSDVEGVVTLGNLFGMSHTIMVVDDRFELPPNPITPDLRDLDVEPKSGETKEVSLQLHPR